MKSLAFLLHGSFFVAFTAVGQTWTTLNSPAGFKNIRAKTINSTGDTVYATDGVNLLKSKDNGQTWAATDSTIPSAIAVTSRADNSDVVLVSGSNLDRKSTRLNSSHGYISYAVFCLKKKKKKKVSIQR